MPWTCKMVEHQVDTKHEIGDMYYAAWMIDGEDAGYYADHFLSPEYFSDWFGKRPPIVVCLPGNKWWCVDSRPAGDPSGWTVTGSEPNLTVSPSINYYGTYHGWLVNGVVSDDIEGKKY